MNTALREHMIELLKTIASPAMQKAYESNAPIANVPDELVCQWFHDFHPATELFRSSFSNNEIRELTRFNEFYDARVESIPDGGDVAKLQTNKEWLEVQTFANDVLNKCGWLSAF